MSAVQVIKRSRVIALSILGALLFATSLFPAATSAQTASCCIAFTGSCTALTGSACPGGQAQVTCSAVAACPASGQCCTAVSSCIPKVNSGTCTAALPNSMEVNCSTFSACGTGSAPAAGSPAPLPAGPPPQAVSLPDPLGGVSLPQVVGGLIKTFTGIAGAIALLMFVYGGIMYILSGGDGEKVKSAMTILRNSTIGLVLIFGAYFFTSAIVSGILANPR